MKMVCAVSSPWLRSARDARTASSLKSTGPSPRWHGTANVPTNCGSVTAQSPNQVLIKDPSLLSPEAREIASYPGGHEEGFPDTFKQLYNKVYRYIFAGDFSKKPDFPTFVDGHYEMVLCEAIEKSAKEGKWVKVGINLLDRRHSI